MNVLEKEMNSRKSLAVAQDVTGEDSYERLSYSVRCSSARADFLPNEVRRVVGQARVTTGSLPGNPQKPTAMH